MIAEWWTFLSFTSSQVVYADATACLKNDKEIPHTHLTQRRRARRLFSIPTVRNRLSSSALDFYYRSSIHLRHYGHALDPVRCMLVNSVDVTACSFDVHLTLKILRTRFRSPASKCVREWHVQWPLFLFKKIYFEVYISRSSAVSSTNYGSIVIFASCVVGTCDTLCGLFSRPTKNNQNNKTSSPANTQPLAVVLFLLSDDMKGCSCCGWRCRCLPSASCGVVGCFRCCFYKLKTRGQPIAYTPDTRFLFRKWLAWATGSVASRRKGTQTCIYIPVRALA